MALVYVSYKSQDEGFVRQVVDCIKPQHEIIIDYDMPVGVDWRSHMLSRLRDAEVFLVFASSLTGASDYQNAEIGSARFCSTFVDQKLIVPVIINHGPVPRTLQDLDALLIANPDPAQAAKDILEAIEHRAPRIRLFISHSHKDEDLASKLVEVITSGLEVPPGALRCTSVPGYQLDLGTMAPESLRRKLGSAAVVTAILTPNSLAAEWVLFELGATWANAAVAIPLLAGGVADKDIPGPFRGAAGGELRNPVTLDHLVDQLSRKLGWPQKHDLPGRQKRYELARYAESKVFARDAQEEEIRAGFGVKRARIGMKQGAILDYVTYRKGNRPFIPQAELETNFADISTSLFYRLEQLRLLGFLHRVQAGEVNGEPTYGWDVSPRYRQELGL